MQAPAGAPLGSARVRHRLATNTSAITGFMTASPTQCKDIYCKDELIPMKIGLAAYDRE